MGNPKLTQILSDARRVIEREVFMQLQSIGRTGNTYHHQPFKKACSQEPGSRKEVQVNI
jgi:hypothetical protein